MTEPGFTDDVLEQFRREREVRIETRATDGTRHRTIVWIVVDEEDRVLVRSYHGARARWFREAVSGRPSAILLDEASVPVSVERATDPERVEACNRWLAAKYAGDPATPAMLREEILDTTLELHPG